MLQNRFVFSIGLAVAFVLHSCKEIGPNINLGGSSKSLFDTTYIESPVQTAEDKTVLMEEFTGVQCVNCPAGHDIIKTLKNNFGDKLVAVSYHTDFLGEPFPFSTEDLRTLPATQVQDFLVFDGYKPAASIDRFAFTTQASLLYPRNTWNNRVQQVLSKTSPVNIKLTPLLDSITRKLTVSFELHYTSTVNDKQKITLMLMENDIIQPQLNTGNVIDTFYVHKDIQRSFLTNVLGDELNTTTEAGRVVRKIYETQLDNKWMLSKMRLVGFVHLDAGSKEVLQAKEVGIN